MILLYLFFMAYMLVAMGMLIMGLFDIIRFLVIMPFLFYGFCSSLLWLLRHKQEVWILQEIISKKVSRRFKNAQTKIKERVDR
jgi:hypothetical protein